MEKTGLDFVRLEWYLPVPYNSVVMRVANVTGESIDSPSTTYRINVEDD
ncbi:MAG: hypothetical protein HPY74_19925 [Firmicutes bacterium]|nr:hypothetical protein [Bacillota bacterium]